MKVIFLDIDGVLNSFQTFKEIILEGQLTGVRRVVIDPIKVDYLKEIVDATGAKIVLSSSWKKFLKKRNGQLVTNNQNMQEIINILNDRGISIYDITPKTLKGNREVEIRKWLEGKNIENFIVLDDDDFDLQGFIGKELVKTDYMKMVDGVGVPELSGLTPSHVKEAIDKLYRSKKLVKM